MREVPVHRNECVEDTLHPTLSALL
jgi:hypothetical protein